MIDRGTPDEYEIVWKSGHVDRFAAHQVSWPNNSRIADMFSLPGDAERPVRVDFHAEVDGRWRLLLSADMADISTIRNVTQVPDQ